MEGKKPRPSDFRKTPQVSAKGRISRGRSLFRAGKTPGGTASGQQQFRALLPMLAARHPGSGTGGRLPCWAG